MDDPKRLLVKKALTTWLEGVTPTNGYQHDLSPGVGNVVRVFRGRDKFGESDPLPCVAILEPLKPDDQIDDAGDGREVIENMVVMIQGWVAEDLSSVHPTDGADRLMADVKKRIGELMGNDLGPRDAKPWHNLYGLLASVRAEPGTVRQPDQFSALSYFYFRVVLSYVEMIDDPYGV